MGTEAEFPTIEDVRDRLSELIERGLGNLPAQVLLLPDSSIQAIARCLGHADDAKPAIAIDLTPDVPTGRSAVMLITADRLNDNPPRTAVQ